ncbi:unnamed protein product [Vitrella brassicaformis CCMP3155]|uniref:Uncharacterized protein n=2 Tax=Vitrella brassicaformis TaxID=1169539 RepID=A0A0G4GJ17_VITBC|nr:unnamed protein product [Vitrella brassicaformis CCMP3155]|eukprot:CEM29827.1 unnamed protein product [Vitrella brassicaformis CCMP3155]
MDSAAQPLSARVQVLKTTGLILLTGLCVFLLELHFGLRNSLQKFRGAEAASLCNATAGYSEEQGSGGDDAVAAISESPPLPVMMHEKEAALVESLLSSDVVALEWGSGGSTFLISPRVQTLYSIEASAGWCDGMQQNAGEAMKVLRRAEKLFFLCANRYAPTKRLSYPTDKPSEAVKAFRGPYIEVMDTLANLRNVTYYDLVLIDGRYRLACLMYALKYTDSKSKLLVHDFDRFKKRIAEQLPNTFELVQEAEKMGWLKKKEGASFDSEEVQSFYKEMILSPGP